jgi:nitrate reductase gamma subunit
MSLEWRARSSSLAWSNPLAWWWGVLTLVSGANIAVWFWLYRQLHEQPTGSLASPSGIELMLLLCAAYVFGCAFRSFLPRADVQRICLFDTWLSSVVVGRSVATVAEICFSAQWAIILYRGSSAALSYRSDDREAVNCDGFSRFDRHLVSAYQ